MPAHVESMMYLGDKPWHGLGSQIEENDAYDIESCIKASGLNWEVSLEPCYARPTKDMLFDVEINIPAYATLRKVNGKYEVLGVVGERYEVLQNIDAFKIFQPFLDNKLVRLNTAGSLFEGRRVWILAEILGDPLEISSDDIIRKFILLSHSHDGTQCVRFGLTPIRVVCFNTLSMAHSSDLSNLIKLKHTKNVLNNLENVREIIDLVNQDFKVSLENYKLLSLHSITSEELDQYVKAVFNVNGDPSTRMANTLERIKSYFEYSPGNNLTSIRGTTWAGYNAVTYYLSHEYGRNDENRLAALWFGKNVDMNKRALQIALEQFV